MSEAELFDDLWKEVETRFVSWKSCELILACPITITKARVFFPEQQIFEIFDPSKWNDFLNFLPEKVFRSIGIISPWLLKYLCQNEGTASEILQRCRYNLVMLLKGDGERFNLIELRRTLHRIGFYEIAIKTEKDKVDFSSIGVLVDGSFSFQASQPGIVIEDYKYSTCIASRLAIPESYFLPWSGIIGCFGLEKGKGYRTYDGDFALAVKKKPQATLNAKEIRVGAVINWMEYKLSHASLVGCYKGPSDTQMYAGLIELQEDTSVFASIWRNDGDWTRLDGVDISLEVNFNNNEGCYRLPFWLKITNSSITLGLNNKNILTVEDASLPRTPSAGIRVFNNNIYFDDVEIDYVY